VHAVSVVHDCPTANSPTLTLDLFVDHEAQRQFSCTKNHIQQLFPITKISNCVQINLYDQIICPERKLTKNGISMKFTKCCIRLAVVLL
jgi:hypothetical protein